MKFRYGSALLGIPLLWVTSQAFAAGIPGGNEQLDEMDLSLLQKYANTKINRSPASDTLKTRSAHSLTVSAIDKNEGAEDLSGPVAPPSEIANKK